MTASLTRPTAIDPGVLESVVVAGDLSKLSQAQRVAYYASVCESLGLNPLTRPFEYLVLNDKLTLYTKRDAADQLRKIHGVSVSIVSRELVEGVYVVTARATTADGRTDESIGAVPFLREDGEWKTAQSGKRYFNGNGNFIPLKPEDRANAAMKAETKAKRRVTLSICGLGWTDESELDGIPNATRVSVDTTTGEILHEPAALPAAAPDPPSQASVVAGPAFVEDNHAVMVLSVKEVTLETSTELLRQWEVTLDGGRVVWTANPDIAAEASECASQRIPAIVTTKYSSKTKKDVITSFLPTAPF